MTNGQKAVLAFLIGIAVFEMGLTNRLPFVWQYAFQGKITNYGTQGPASPTGYHQPTPPTTTTLL